MNQDRMKNQSDRDRMDREPAEGSRENVRGGGSSSSERGLGGSSGMQGGTSKGSDIPDRERDELEQDEMSERGRSSDSER